MTSVHSNASKKKKKKRNGICGSPILRSIRGFIPSNDSGTCRSNGEKPCRSIRPRKVFGKCFPKCFVHRYRFPIQRNSRFFSLFFFSPPSLFFSPEFGGKKYSRILMNPFRGISKIEKSMFRIDIWRGEREKKERKKQIEGKRFHRRISRIGFEACSYNTSRIGAFIYSSRNSFVTRQTCKNTKIGIAFRNLVRRGY